MYTIQIIRESTGKPVKGARVVVGYDGLLGGVTDARYTDANGEVHINMDPGKGTVYVDGSSKYKGRISGRTLIYI